MDATFTPPPLADPFTFGVDCILHSGSKYLGGHSDIIAGVLVVPTSAEFNEVSLILELRRECSSDHFVVRILSFGPIGLSSGTIW